jgi:hypothetical protein
MVYKDSIIKKLEKEYKLIHKHLVAYPNKNKIEQSISVYGFEGDEILVYLERSKLLESFEEVADDEFASSDVSRDVKSNAVNVYILYTNEKEFEKVLGLLERQETEKKNNINLIVGAPGEGYTLREFTTKLPSKEIDLELNYGKEFVKKHETIIDRLNQQNGSGLVVLNGKPGTGKTTYIKYLTTQIEKRIIFVPPSMAESLTGPNLLPFLMENKNSILIIEDAEKVIRSRDSQDNAAVSNILNITDGLLGDCLNIFVIATFNTDRDNVDKALLRKGRLLYEHHFDDLSVEKCNKIFEKLEIDRRTNVPLTLADIFNNEDNYSKKEEKNKIGF